MVGWRCAPVCHRSVLTALLCVISCPVAAADLRARFPEVQISTDVVDVSNRQRVHAAARTALAKVHELFCAEFLPVLTPPSPLPDGAHHHAYQQRRHCVGCRDPRC